MSIKKLKAQNYLIEPYHSLDKKLHFMAVRPLTNMVNKNVNLALDKQISTRHSGVVFHTSLNDETMLITYYGSMSGWTNQIDEKNKHQSRRSRRVSFQDKMLYGIPYRKFKRRAKKYPKAIKRYKKKYQQYKKTKKGRPPKKPKLYGTTPLKSGLIEFGNAKTVPKIYSAIKNANPNSSKKELSKRTYHALNKAMESTINQWNDSYLGKAMPIVSFTTNFDENKKHTGALHAHTTLLMCGKTAKGKLSCDKNRAIQSVVKHVLGKNVNNRTALSLMKNKVTDPLINNCFGSELRKQFPEVKEFQNFKLVRDPLDNFHTNSMGKLKKIFKNNDRKLAKQKSLLHKQSKLIHNHHKSISKAKYKKYQYSNEATKYSNSASSLINQNVAMGQLLSNAQSSSISLNIDNSFTQNQLNKAKRGLTLTESSYSVSNSMSASVAINSTSSELNSEYQLSMTKISSSQADLDSSSSNLTVLSSSVSQANHHINDFNNHYAEKLAKAKKLDKIIKSEQDTVNKLRNETKLISKYKQDTTKIEHQLVTNQTIKGAIKLILTKSSDYLPNGSQNMSKLDQIKQVAYYYFNPQERNKQIRQNYNKAHSEGVRINEINNKAKQNQKNIAKNKEKFHHFSPESTEAVNQRNLQTTFQASSSSSSLTSKEIKLWRIKHEKSMDR